MKTWAVWVLAALLLAGPVAASEPVAGPDRPLADAGQEARAKALFRDVRCVVCQHEAISDSPAGIAADMRALVREQVAAGKTDEEVRSDLVRRYGDYVLFTPPVRAATWLLWFGPFAAVVLVGVWFIVRSRKNRSEVQPLSPDEEAALMQLLETKTDDCDEVVSKPPQGG